MRFAILTLSLGLAACGSRPASTDQLERETATGGPVLTFQGAGRDRLCLRNAGDKFAAGLIVYAASSNANCSVRGLYQAVDRPAAIEVPGDACRIAVSGDLKGTVTLGPLDPACHYYCGPGATYAGKSFRRTATSVPVTDLAGDPLC